jgi:hypothetical protein
MTGALLNEQRKVTKVFEEAQFAILPAARTGAWPTRHANCPADRR